MTSTATSSQTSSPSSQLKPSSSASGRELSIKLDPSERWFIVGKTGSGKTYLVRYLLGEWVRKGWRVVIVDPKHDWCGQRPKWARTGPGTIESPWLVRAFNPKLRVQCFQPTLPAWNDNAYQTLCRTLLRQRNVIVYHDELSGVATAHRAAQGFLELWTMGRALNVAAWASFQRPRKIPEEVKSQAETWAVFRIPAFPDRKDIADYVGDPRIITDKLPKWWWWYWQQERDEAQLMRPIDVKQAA